MNKQEEGFTLIELVATVALMSILFVMAVGGYKFFYTNRALDVAAREITAQIREAQAKAVSTGNTHRIVFNTSDSTYILQRRQGSEWANAGAPGELPSRVFFDSAAPPDFAGDADMEFYARGLSDSGTLVLRNSNSKTKTISVDGETVHVVVEG